MAGDEASSGTGEAHGRRIDDIEVLRAFAVCMVMAHHAMGLLIPWLPGTKASIYRVVGLWSGVDLFLAISGFVIARSLLPLLPAPGERQAFFRTTLSFWIRRAWRLLPSAWLWLAIPLAASLLFNRSGAFGSFQANLAGSLAAVFDYANFHEAYAFGRYPTGAVFPYWSLSLEEQFYLALPFVIFLARGRLSMVLVAIAASQFFIKRVGPFGDLLFANLRCDALCLGVLLAIWSRSAEYRRLEPAGLATPLARWLLPAVFVAVFALAAGPALGYPRCTVGVLALLAATIVWIASYDRDYLLPPGRVKRAACWVGARSYAMYLIHIPVYCATIELWTRLRPAVLRPGLHHAALLVATGLPVVLLLADINYRFVERPLRRHGALIAERIRLRGLFGTGDPARQAA